MRRPSPDSDDYLPVTGSTGAWSALPASLESGLEPLGLASARGFTRLDLLAVIVVLGILFLLLLPTLARPGLNSKSFQCLNNHRQLCNAWRMYADDNGDRMVYSSHDGSGGPQNNYAWTWSEMSFSSDPKNWDANADIVLRPLWPYTARDASIYKCPEDQSYVLVNGVAKPRVRSVSVNFFLGGYAGTSQGAPGASPYSLFLKTTELTAPGPATTFVFIDQRADSINWGNFLTDMTGYSPANPTTYRFSLDIPGFLHDGAATLSFADGHTELHRWVDRRTIPKFSQNGPSLPSGIASPNNPDIAWLQDHATRLK